MVILSMPINDNSLSSKDISNPYILLPPRGCRPFCYFLSMLFSCRLYSCHSSSFPASYSSRELGALGNFSCSNLGDHDRTTHYIGRAAFTIWAS